MQSSLPFFSVIIPLYNADKFIETAINSVLNQSFGHWEIIIVDDKSTDNSLPLIKKLYGEDKRIKIFSQETNGGAAAARNKAIMKSSGDWCCFLDSDNEMDAGYMKEAYTHLSVAPTEVGIFWTGFKRVIHESNKIIESKNSCWSPDLNLNNDKILFLINKRIGTGTALSVKKKYLIEAGLFDESLRAAEDTELIFRLIWKCNFIYSKLILFTYNVYKDKKGRLTTNYKNQFIAYQVIYKKNESLFLSDNRLMKSVLMKLIRYSIFSNNKKNITKKYLLYFNKNYGYFNKLTILYLLSFIFGNRLLINFYSMGSNFKKSHLN